MDDEEARGRGMLTSRRPTTMRVQEGDDEQEGEEEDEVIGVEGQRGGMASGGQGGQRQLLC